MKQDHESWWFFLKFNGQYDFEYENDKFSLWVTWYDHFWKEPKPKKVVYLHLYYHNFWNICPKSIKIVFLDSYCHVLSRSKIIPDDVIMTSLS